MRTSLMIPLFFATAATGVLAQGIQLKLNRPESAGRISGYIVDQTYCSTTTLSPKGGTSESNVTKNRIRFEARREVIAVGSDGAATRVKYTIANFQRRDNDGPVSEVFPAGRV
ncbi:MAG: hypothetical protein MUF04_14685, partial [Akkermansiaceae bacterium]|nr:hypothetical protein [Akkermansiaceae bacterium]